MEKDFSSLFDLLCEESNKNNAEIAELLDVDRATIGRWRTGERSPKLSKIPEIAKLFNVDIKIIAETLVDNVKVPLPEPTAVRTIPIYGEISCGNGLFVDDNVIEYFSLPTSMLPSKSKEYFAQYASGDSMINAGIREGDLIIFSKDAQIDNGDIGCFCIDENTATLKKFSMNNGEIYLLPANDNYTPIRIDVENECFRIVGKMVLRIGK